MSVKRSKITRIFVDLSKLKHPNTGLASVCAGFLQGLAKQNWENLAIDLLLPAKIIPKYRVLYGRKFGYLPYFPAYKLYFYWRKYALIHYPHQDFSLRFLPRRTHLLLCVHDLNFLVEKSCDKQLRYLKNLQNKVLRAEYLTTISKATKYAMHANLQISRPVKVIYNGLPNLDLSNSDTILTPKLPVKFILSIGVLYPKKRFEYLIRMLEYLPADWHLLIIGTGKSAYFAMLSEWVAKLGLQKRVHFTGAISDAEKAIYLKHCQAYLSASSAEGFGLPILEALSFGKPVFLSKIAAHEEIASNFAHYFEDLNPAIMAELFLISMQKESEKSLQNERIAYAKQFSWEFCAQKYLEIYKSYLQKPMSSTIG